MKTLKLLLLGIILGIFGTTRVANAVPQGQESKPTIMIDLKAQTLTYQNGGIARTFHCSTGREGYRTPKGKFTVYAKERHAISYKYGNSPMPFTLWFHPAGYGIHESKSVPNYPASHGCVRLKHEDAKWLFEQVPVGTPVTIK
ncbi:MAG: L,D-transpeptidase [Parcubacteria group bacterium]|nr:L,D-transpeptidase [Parcubacteria group bacterium]